MGLVRVSGVQRTRLSLALAAAPPLAVVGLPPARGYSVASWRDSAQQLQPMRWLVVEALRELRLPLWNPYQGTGIPLLAEQVHGVLHPVSVALAWVAPEATGDHFVLAYVALAATGAFLLARTLGASPVASLAAAWGYALSGYVLSMSSIWHYLGGAAMAPWMVAGLSTAGRSGIRGVALGAVAVACCVFAGDPQVAIVGGLLGLALAADAGGRRGAARASGAIVLGVALAAVQLLPGWAALGQSLRSTGLPDRELGQWSLVPARLVELLSPGFFTGPRLEIESPVFARLDPGTFSPNPWAPSIHVGALLLALAVVGMATGRRSARILAGGAVVSLWVALGPALGAQQLLGAVPVWGAFRFAEKLVGPLSLCLAALGALGLDAAARREAPAASAGLAALALAASLSVAFAASLFPGEVDALLSRTRLGADAAPIARANLAIGMAFSAAGFAAALAVLRASRRSAALALWIGAAAVLAASAAAARHAWHLGDSSALARALPPRIEAPPYGARIMNPMSEASDPTLDSIDGATASWLRLGLRSASARTGVGNLDVYSPLRPLRHYQLLATAGRDVWRVGRRYAMTHVVVPDLAPPLPLKGGLALADAVLAYRDPHVQVWSVPHRPWAAFAPGVMRARSQPKALRLAVDLARAGRQEVVLETQDQLLASPGEVLSISRRPERIRIEARSAGEAVLVVNDSFWPGWNAEIDGRAVQVYAADGLVRAVRWPSGRHVLEMRYEPPQASRSARRRRSGWRCWPWISSDGGASPPSVCRPLDADEAAAGGAPARAPSTPGISLRSPARGLSSGTRGPGSRAPDRPLARRPRPSGGRSGPAPR
jgi:hypothetical protein